MHVERNLCAFRIWGPNENQSFQGFTEHLPVGKILP